jgi:uncharacterized protein with gpF-like domain
MATLVLPPRPDGRRPKREKRPRRARGIRPSTRIEKDAQQRIDAAVAPFLDEISRIANMAANLPVDDVLDMLSAVGEKARAALGPDAERIAGEWMTRVSDDARRQLEKSIGWALRVDDMGIDMTRILDDPAVAQAISVSSAEAASLITDIPAEMAEKTRRLVLQNFQQIPLPDGMSLTDAIQNELGISRRRARLIARDQTRKANAVVNQTRSTSIGIEEYIWRCVDDMRVVGRPGGLYPKGSAQHGNHWKLNGRKFRYDSPPAQGPGNPGWGIGCRCFAEPVIDPDKIHDAAVM